jgi:hypothetical protein
MAILPHVGSSEVSPNHTGCPVNSWCKYKLNPDKYTHKNGLPQAVMDFIRPVFTDLAKEDLLRRCLHGKTQNNNEALNKLIWERCSKEVYVERETIEEAVLSAISYLKDWVFLDTIPRNYPPKETGCAYLDLLKNPVKRQNREGRP